MLVGNFVDAILFSLTGKLSSDYAENKKINYPVIVKGLTDLRFIYGAKKDKVIPGDLYPYLRFDIERIDRSGTITKPQSVKVFFEIGLKLEREANSNIKIIEYVDSFRNWLDNNDFLKLNGNVITVAGETWTVELQYAINSQRQTVDERYAIFQGGWKIV